MKPIRVILVDDHTLVRAGIRLLLQGVPEVEIVAEAGNGYDALQLVEKHLPDVVLADIAMPGLNGLDLTARIAEKYPKTRVLLLSMHANEEYVLQALRLGAAGYLLKDAGTTELELAIRAVANGEAYLSPAISRHVIDGYVQRLNSKSHDDIAEAHPHGNLSTRQRQVLQLIAEGYTTKEIAQKLGIHVKTIEAHRTRLMNDLDIHDIAGLVRYAIRIGLVSAE